MHRATLFLALLTALAFCPDLKAGQWRSAYQPAYEEQTEPDEQTSERRGKLFLLSIAGVISVAVGVQILREWRELSPSRSVIQYASDEDSESIVHHSILLPVPFEQSDVQC